MSKRLKSRRELMLEELRAKMKPLIFDLYILDTTLEDVGQDWTISTDVDLSPENVVETNPASQGNVMAVNVKKPR